MQKVIIPYAPRAWALPFHNSGKRYSVLIVHRRAGKTVACVNHLIRDALRTPKSNFAYIAPTFTQAKRIAWDFVKEFSRVVPMMQYNESELTAKFPNGSKIFLLGAENPDSLRGLSLSGAILDEYSQQPASIFTEVIAPALADKRGYAVWIGTPKGMNELVRLYNENKNNPDWYTLTLKASESGVLPKEELDALRRVMSEEEYEQELEVSFTAFIKGAVYQKQLAEAREQKRICGVPYDPSVPVNTYWDLGISDSTAIIIAQRVGREMHIIDCIEGSGNDIAHYAQALKEKKYLLGRHYLPHDARAREKATGLTCEEIVGRIFGSENVEITPMLTLADGIESARRFFSSCWFDEAKTLPLLSALTQYQYEWDDKSGSFRRTPKHDWTSHFADAFRYMSLSVYREPEAARPTQFIPNLSRITHTSIAKKIAE